MPDDRLLVHVLAGRWQISQLEGSDCCECMHLAVTLPSSIGWHEGPNVVTQLLYVS